MKRPVIVALGLFVFLPGAAAAVPGDFRVIDGVVGGPPAPGGAPVARVDGADGVSYYADLRTARFDPAHLRTGEPVTLAGYEGAQPNQITAAALDPREPEGAASPTTSGVPRPAPSAAAVPDREPAERVQGRIEAIDGSTATLRGGDGRLVTVDLSQIRVDFRRAVRVGDRVTVFGLYDEDQRLTATGFYAVVTP